jgi:hypothetical protein
MGERATALPYWKDLTTSTPDAVTIPKRLLRRPAFFIFFVLAIAVGVIGGVVLSRNNGSQSPSVVLDGTQVAAVATPDALAAALNSSEYQAVFLTNGQIYFGKLTAPGGDYYYLRHIYYLQSQVSPQGGKTVQPSLTKLGGEIHGPEDLMVINRSQILFVENLKPSGEVSKAISSAGGG